MSKFIIKVKAVYRLVTSKMYVLVTDRVATMYVDLEDMQYEKMLILHSLKVFNNDLESVISDVSTRLGKPKKTKPKSAVKPKKVKKDGGNSRRR